jgi:hypothetical protein
MGDLECPGMVIEYWDDVPSPSQNLLMTRDRIRAHVEQLVMALKHGEDCAPDTAQGAC